MWAWFVGAYAIVLLVLMAIAAVVASLWRDQQQRQDAYRVLKLILGMVTGAGGLVMVALRLHELGLLR